MIVKQTYNLCEFEPWSGAVDTWQRIIDEDKMDDFENLLDELYYGGEIEEVKLNDLLWFESDWVYEQLGITEDDPYEDEEE